MPRPTPATRRSSLLALAAGVATAGIAALTASVIRTRRHFELAGKVALVTGGSRGLGLAIARELVERGAKVAICARGEDALRHAQEDLQSRGGDVLALTCDVTQADEIADAVRQTREHFGPIDVLVNNAATITVASHENLSLADYRDAMDVIYEASLLFMADVLPEMRQRGSGRVINVASFGGKIPCPHLSAYCAAKHALVGLSQTLRTELVPHGVYVTTVNPGLIRTGSAMRSALFKGKHREERDWFTNGDVTPVVSIDAARLARQIVDASVRGDAELTSPFPAAIQSSLVGAFPGVATEVATLINRFLLPKPSDAPDAGTARLGSTLGEEGLSPLTRRNERTAEDRYQHGSNAPDDDA